MLERIAARETIYTHEPEPGLLSILTAVWNGSPPKYLRVLTQRIAEQNASSATEWIVLDNGCTRTGIRTLLNELSGSAWVKVIRSEENLGITRGLRRCLEAARGKYVLPVDADDLLDHDALRVVASVLFSREEIKLLYTDEDKIIGTRRYQPYLKPNWDPVLLLNSAYTAHLGVIHRETALALGAYSDPETEGSPDWDLFVRFLIEGYTASHIAEVIYSWRVHASSTADDDATKSYIGRSQRAVLQRFLDSRPEGKRFKLEPSPLFAGGAHWHFRRKPDTAASVGLARAEHRAEWLRAADCNRCIALVASDIELRGDDWMWEAIGIFELHPDAVVVCGRIRDQHGVLIEAGLELDDSGAVTNPHKGKLASDAGYFGQLWKQRSVSAASARLAVVRSEFLLSVIDQIQSKDFAAAAGKMARQMHRRIVYTPFIEGTCRSGSDSIS